MPISQFQNIIGDARADTPATIRFFGRVTEESTTRFNEEFDYLENVVKPSCIRILINSEGGSVLHGMTTYSTIQNSKIDTECVNEGMAASMGSIIWAAGKRSLMRDYSILMIHNPMCPSEDDEEPSDMVKAFTKQIETIYRKRFGLKAEHIRAIMNGEAGNDGTYFDAAGAVKAGIIPEENILRTSRQLCEKVKNELSALHDPSDIEAMMARVCAENKHFDTVLPTLIQTKTSIMDDKKTPSPEYGAVTASLGMNDKSEIKEVMARITELMSVEAKFTQTTQALKDAQTVIAGKDATIINLQKDLATASAALTTYKEKEANEKKLRNKTMIEAAIVAGKIARETETEWLAMAEENPTLVEKTLSGIPEREQISKEIAADPSNVQAAAAAIQSAEAKIAEQVQAVVGDKFEFRKLK